MSTDSFRSVVREMDFHLYTRPLHPELFETIAQRRVTRDDYSISIRITPTGHILTWETRFAHLTEITGPTDRQLPRRGEILRHRVLGEKSEGIRLANGVAYQMRSHLEFLTPEVFMHVHDELLDDGRRRGMLVRVYPDNRFALSPLGYITMEAWKGGAIAISTWHTFPEEFAVVKTQSLIERE